MNPFDDNADNWLERELREVPLPEQLLRSLHDIAVGSDDQLDAALRHVPLPARLLTHLLGIAQSEDTEVDQKLRQVDLPEGLLARLQDIPNVGTYPIDHQLSDVPMPTGLLDRLSAISNEVELIEWNDAQLDKDLRAVPLPVHLNSKLKQIASAGPAQTARVSSTVTWRFVVAASLMLMIVGTYAMAISQFVVDAYGIRQSPAAVIDLDEPSLILLETETVAILETSVRGFEVGGNEVDPLVEDFASLDRFLLPVETSDSLGDIQQFLATNDLLRTLPLGRHAPVAERIIESLSPVRVISAPQTTGIHPPLDIPGKALTFFVRERVYPEIDIEAAPAMANTAIPLSLETASFVETLHRLKKGDLPDKEAIRTEHFLNAVSGDWAQPAEGLALRVAAGPSPLSRPKRNLLQIGVQSASLPVSAAPGQITVVVDGSIAMSQDRALDKTKHALHRFIDQLAPDDAVTLILFRHEAYVLTEFAGTNRRDELHQAVEELQAFGSKNLERAMQLATQTSAFDGMNTQANRRCVLITHGSGFLTEKQRGKITSHMAGAINQGTSLEVLDLESLGDDRSPLASLVANVGGKRISCRTPKEMERVLVYGTDEKKLVAREISLKIKFHPESVRGYRLLGHEAETLLSADEYVQMIDLMAGENASALCELDITPQGPELVATLELSWRDSKTGKIRSSTQEVRRAQFARDFVEAAPSLQMATLAMGTAELLRDHTLARRNRVSLKKIIDLSHWIDEPAKRDARHQELLRLLDLARDAGVR